MGLSNGERFSKVCWGVSRMSNLKFTDYGYTKLNKVLKKLWPAFLSNRGDGAFWIFGGELDQTFFSENGLLTSAFSNVLSDFKEENKEDNDWNDHLDNSRDYRPTMYDLLYHVSVDKANLARLFVETENINYATNRYADKFSKNFTKIKDLNAELQGMIFNIMSGDSDYLHAKITADVINQCIPYDDKDIVRAWFNKHNIHHGVRMANISKPKMMQLFRKIRKADYNSLSAQERFDIILELTGLHFHYDHQHKELFILIEKWNKSHKKDRVDLDKAKGVCADINKKHAINEKERGKEYRKEQYCHLISDWEFEGR